MKTKCFLLITILFITTSLIKCRTSNPIQEYSPPAGLRLVNQDDIGHASAFGVAGTTRTDLDSTIMTALTGYCSRVYYMGDGYSSPSTMTQCLALEFYANHTGISIGYNVYVVQNGAWTTEAQAWAGIKDNLKYYQMMHDNYTDGQDVVYPLLPGKITGEQNTSISNPTYDTNMTKFIAVFNRFYTYNVDTANALVAGTYWIAVTTVNYTDELESVPSSVLKLVIP